MLIHNYEWKMGLSKNFKRDKQSTVSIIRTYYSVWVMELGKNDRIGRKRKCCFIKTMH